MQAMNFCGELNSDVGALHICEYMRSNFGSSKEDLDVLLLKTVHTDKRSTIIRYVDPGEDLIPLQVRQAAIELAAKEEAGLVDRYELQGVVPELASTELVKFVERADSINLSLFNRNGSALKRELAQVLKFKQAVLKDGFVHGTVDYQKAMAKAIFGSLKEDIGKVGMECSTFSAEFIRLCRYAGITARPAWVFTDPNDDDLSHVRPVAVFSDGSTAHFDPFVEYDPAQNWSFVALTDLVSDGIMFAGRDLSGTSAKKSMLEKAMLYSLNDEIAPIQMGVLLGANGDLRGALDHFLEAYGRNPFSPMAAYDLYACYKRLGENDNADKYCDIFKNITGSLNCFWFSRP